MTAYKLRNANVRILVYIPNIESMKFKQLINHASILKRTTNFNFVL